MPTSDKCTLLQKRIEQAKIKGCQDSSFLEGAICTNRCEFNKTCSVERVPVLIQAITNNIILGSEYEYIAGLNSSIDVLTGWQPDEYIIGGQERNI